MIFTRVSLTPSDTWSTYTPAGRVAVDIRDAEVEITLFPDISISVALLKSPDMMISLPSRVTLTSFAVMLHTPDISILSGSYSGDTRPSR